jgi:hypothetical protein
VKELAKLASIASVYAGSIGFLYLWSYWKRFGVNFLEFASLTDLIRLSLMPIVGTSLLVLVVNTVQHLLDPIDVKPYKEKPAATREERLANLIFKLLATLLVVAAAGFLIWRIAFRDEAAYWLLVAPLVASWATIRMKEEGRQRAVTVRRHRASSQRSDIRRRQLAFCCLRRWRVTRESYPGRPRI